MSKILPPWPFDLCAICQFAPACFNLRSSFSLPLFVPPLCIGKGGPMQTSRDPRTDVWPTEIKRKSNYSTPLPDRARPRIAAVESRLAVPVPICTFTAATANFLCCNCSPLLRSSPPPVHGRPHCPTFSELFFLCGEQASVFCSRVSVISSFLYCSRCLF